MVIVRMAQFDWHDADDEEDLLSHDGDAARVPTEGRDVPFDPLEAGNLISYYSPPGFFYDFGCLIFKTRPGQAFHNCLVRPWSRWTGSQTSPT